MKLRQNKLSPLKFDEQFAQSILLQESSSHGPLKPLFETILGRLDAIRHRWFETVPNGNTTSFSSYAGRIVNLPADTLTHYTTQRSQSVLTHIFELAARYQSNADRVVFLGNAQSQSIVRCIAEACCDPYWNERTRAERGSKPRMYFAGEAFDNDSHQALLELFAPQRTCNRFEDYDWGVVQLTPSLLKTTASDSNDLTSPPNNSVAAFASVLRVLRATRSSHNRFESNQFPPSEHPTTHKYPASNDRLSSREYPSSAIESELTLPTDPLWIDCSANTNTASHSISDLPPSFSELYSPFSIVGLLPAAILGVNIMELLAGASFISKEFELKPASENPILRWTAWNALIRTIGAPRQLRYWNNTLRGGMEWLMHLWTQGSPRNLNSPAWRLVPPSDPTQSNLTMHSPIQWQCHLMVNQVRHDALEIPGTDPSSASSFPVALKSQYSHQLRSLGQISSTAAPAHQVHGLVIELPILDELAIGQWMQWMMLSTLLQQELLHQEPLDELALMG
jgi:glucose-6-phosphate isomerase